MWIVLSLGGMGLLATMLLLFVPAYHAGVDPAVVLFYVWAVGTPCIFVYIKLRRLPLRVPRTADDVACRRGLHEFCGERVLPEGDESCAKPGISLPPLRDRRCWW